MSTCQMRDDLYCDNPAVHTVYVFNVFKVDVCEEHYKDIREIAIHLLAGMDWISSPVDWELVEGEVDSWMWSLAD